MTIEVTELEGSFIQSLRDPRVPILINGKYPVTRIYQNDKCINILSNLDENEITREVGRFVSCDPIDLNDMKFEKYEWK